MALTIGDAVPDFVAASTKGEIRFHKVRRRCMLPSLGDRGTFTHRNRGAACLPPMAPMHSFWTMDLAGPCFCKRDPDGCDETKRFAIQGLRSPPMSCRLPARAGHNCRHPDFRPALVSLPRALVCGFRRACTRSSHPRGEADD